MQTYIVFLRGINVGGHKKILMHQLTDLFTEIGCTRVKTYIQSGNVICNSALSKNELTLAIETKIRDYFSFEVATLVCTVSTVESILNSIPFTKEEIVSKSYFTLLYKQPDKDLELGINQIKIKDEIFFATPQCVYFYCAKGAARATCSTSYFEKSLKVQATTRNFKTMRKVFEIATSFGKP